MNRPGWSLGARFGSSFPEIWASLELATDVEAHIRDVRRNDYEVDVAMGGMSGRPSCSNKLSVSTT
jgi:hypothetical protein